MSFCFLYLILINGYPFFSQPLYLINGYLFFSYHEQVSKDERNSNTKANSRDVTTRKMNKNRSKKRGKYKIGMMKFLALTLYLPARLT